MSLLIFSSANRIAHSVIRRLHNANIFERIVCADPYPNYFSIQRFLNFKHQLAGSTSTTKLIDIQISQKSDLREAISKSSHVLYITHDYYSLVPSKINLIKTVSELIKDKKDLQKFVALTPLEYDHYNEANPIYTARKSEEEAFEICPNMVLLKSDLTFGPDSTICNDIVSRIVNGYSLNFQPRTIEEKTAPIHTDNIADVVEKIFRDDSIKGKGYALQGPDQVTLGNLISILQKYTGKQVNLNEGPLERVLPPYQSNILTEALYAPEYINLASLLRQYRTMEKAGLNEVGSLGLKLKNLEATYQPQTVDEELYKVESESKLDYVIKKFIY